jgi:hypothetical protein
MVSPYYLDGSAGWVAGNLLLNTVESLGFQSTLPSADITFVDPKMHTMKNVPGCGENVTSPLKEEPH